MVMEEYFMRFPSFSVLMNTSASLQLSLYLLSPIVEETEKSLSVAKISFDTFLMS